MNDRVQSQPSLTGGKYPRLRPAKHLAKHTSSAVLLTNRHHRATTAERTILAIVLALSALLITILLAARILASNLFQR